MGEITVASTTDTQKVIDTVAGAAVIEPEPKEKEQEQPEPPQPADKAEQPEEKPRAGETKSAYQKRMDKLVRRINELENEVRAAKQPPKEEAREEIEAKPAEAQRPQPEQFKTWEEYTEALTDWKIDQREAKKAQDAIEQEQQAKLKKTLDAYNRQADAARLKYDDFNETLSESVPIYTGVQMVIMELENGAEVAYYLGKHREVAEKLMEMSETRAMAEVGKIAANLGDGTVEEDKPSSETDEEEEEEKPVHKASPPPRRAVSQAPAPITPVGGSATKSSVPLDDLPYSEYRKIRDQQVKNRYRR